MILNFDKLGGLVPAVVQDAQTLQVLMVGFMNEEAFNKTKSEGKVTFFSRERQTLWTKGETSGNYLTVKEIFTDCDQDTVLITAVPDGPTCHTGAVSCFSEQKVADPSQLAFLEKLDDLIRLRQEHPSEESYVSKLFAKGADKVAQKVGEEGVEVVIAALAQGRDRLLEEGADLLFHLMILLRSQGVCLTDVVRVLEKRNR